MNNFKKFIKILIIFLFFYFVPIDNNIIRNAIMEAFYMLQDYARNHMLFCLIPAFFIAGAISNFISQGAVLKYLGSKANKVLAYSVASVSGTILAVCSCTVLPLFASVYKKGAGLGPAISFLYSGPAINVLAIILTARVLGVHIGIARTIGAIFFSVLIGIIMHFLFIKEEREKNKELDHIIIPDEKKPKRSLVQTSIYIFSMIAILIFVNWQKDENLYFWNIIYKNKYFITSFFLIFLLIIIILWFKKEELKSWLISSYDFALQIIPLLFLGIFFSGLFLGRPGHEGIIPSKWIITLVGGNSLFANFFASVIGAFMYFATLTEIPILQGLIGNGMGKGPALALLLSGPALSLPNMLAIKGIIGPKKTVIYVLLVIIMSTITGIIFGYIMS